MKTNGADMQIAEWRDRYDEMKHSERMAVRANIELQKAIGKERDQVERLRNALFVLNARFHSVCNSIGPHVSALYLEDLAEVRALLGGVSISSKEPACPTTHQSKTPPSRKNT
jgi:chromosome segregation ATPase